MFGRDDSDYLSGDAGSDLLLGGDGSDIMYGQAGNDVLIGGLSSDTLYGNAGSDLLLGDDMDDFTAMDLFAAWVSTGTSDLESLRGFTSGAVEDGLADALNGQLGDDWFVAFLNDRVRDASQFAGDHLDPTAWKCSSRLEIRKPSLRLAKHEPRPAFGRPRFFVEKFSLANFWKKLDSSSAFE